MAGAILLLNAGGRARGSRCLRGLAASVCHRLLLRALCSPTSRRASDAAVAILAEKRERGSSSAPTGVRPLTSASTVAAADGPPDYLGTLELVFAPLAPLVEVPMLRTIRQAVEYLIETKVSALAEKVSALAEKDKVLAFALAEKDKMLAEKDKVLAEKDKVLAFALAENDKVLAEKVSALAEKDKMLAEKDKLLEVVEDRNTLMINAKAIALASFKAQYEPRIMLDILWTGLESAQLFDRAQSRAKWQMLVRDVLHEGKLTEAAEADLKDLDGLNELPTVIYDLGSLANRLCSAHHKGATDFGGTGWRLGVSPSPGLATALVLAAVARTLRKEGIDSMLAGRIIYLNPQCEDFREFDKGSLRWVGIG